MTMGSNEGFKEYAQKWRDLAGRVQPPLSERELVDMFLGTLSGPFFDHLIRSSSTGLIESILTRERELKPESRAEKFKRMHLLPLLSRKIFQPRKRSQLFTPREIKEELSADQR